MTTLPRQLHDFEPLTGIIKEDYSDFMVEEIPLYPADGVGTHTYFLLEKAGLSTMQATHDIARALNLPRHNIGFAGQKDARAVTRQWMSVEHVEPERIAALDIARMRVLETTRHHNKLRLGHLKGNAFIIKVRDSEPDRLAELQDALRQLTTSGVPNYFGEQRFGYRGDSWRIGRAVIRGEIDEALDLILGRPTDDDHGPIRQARKYYDRGNFAAAARAWPNMFHTERRALRTLHNTGGKRRAAFSSIDRATRNFFASAYQSHLFNQVVAARLPEGLGQLWEGDLAWIHASGAVFRVEDVAREQERAAAFEISPSGPLFGYRMTEPTGRAAELEGGILEAEGFTREEFRGERSRVKGSRRALRFHPGEAKVSLGADESGPYLELRFVLPRGCYATALLGELFHLKRAGGHVSGDDDTEAVSP